MRLRGTCTKTPFFREKYKLNYLSFQKDSNHIPSCTSAGSVLQLCKISLISNKPFRRSCAYEVQPPSPLFVKNISSIISPSKFWTATIFLQAYLQAVYYNCIKFHKHPISRLGGVVLMRYNLSTFHKKYKLNYLPFQIFASYHIPSCTSAGSLLQLYKVL